MRVRASLHYAATIALALTVAESSPAIAQHGDATRAATARARLAAADSAFAAGDPLLARRRYLAVLETDSENSRATYQLAALAHDRPEEAVRHFKRYVALEPSDAWGHIALGDALARIGSIDHALTSYAAAERLAPEERDVHIGRARILARARRTDAAIAAYERWTVGHPTDAEAWRELATQRSRAGRMHGAITALERAQSESANAATARRLRALRAAAAPWTETAAGVSRDSDGNHLARLAISIGSTPADALGLRFLSSATRVGDQAVAATIYDAGLGGTWRPRASLHVQGRAALVIGGDVAGEGRALPTGDVRLDWRDANGAAALGLRATRTVVVASPTLIGNHVVRDELGGRIDVPMVGPLRLRGLARTARISADSDRNRRRLVGGGVVLATSGGEVSAIVQQIDFAHPTKSGYFAPRSARIAEMGSYAELESAAGVRLAVDVGGGAQQITEWGVAPGRWTPAMRAWSELAFPLAPGREIRLELEGYDALIGGGSDLSTRGSWRFGSATIALHWAVD